MNQNPYAPPVAPVADITVNDDLVRLRSKIIIFATFVPAIIGSLILFFGTFGMVNAISTKQPTSLGAGIGILAYGAVSIAAALGIHKRAKRAAIMWTIVCGMLFVILLPMTPKVTKTASSTVLAIVVALQLIAAVIAVVSISRSRRV